MDTTQIAADTKALLYNKTKKKAVTWFIPWLFVLPGILLTAWLRYFPIFKGMYMSFFEYDVVKAPGKFVGLGNYIQLFRESFFWNAWKNTLIFLMLSLVLTFLIPIIQALFLNEIIKFRKIFTTVYIIPTVIPISVNVILWKWVWNPDNGLANKLTNFLGLGKFTWLSDPHLTKFAIIFPGVIGGGMAVLFYLAAIQSISQEIYDAASIDGSSRLRSMFTITLPNITFMIMIQFILTVISIMQLLDPPFQFTSGGPSGASTSIAVYIYKTATEDLMYGKSSAAAVMLFLVIIIMTMLQMKLSKNETN